MNEKSQSLYLVWTVKHTVAIRFAVFLLLFIARAVTLIEFTWYVELRYQSAMVTDQTHRTKFHFFAAMRGSDMVRSTGWCQFSKKFPAGFCPWAAKRRGYDLGGCPRGRFDLLFAIYDVPPFYRPSAIFCVFIVHQELCTIITSQHQKLWWLGEGPNKGA